MTNPLPNATPAGRYERLRSSAEHLKRLAGELLDESERPWSEAINTDRMHELSAHVSDCVAEYRAVLFVLRADLAAKLSPVQFGRRRRRQRPKPGKG